MIIDKLISDIELRLYKGKPSDDAEIPRSQIRNWLDIVNSAMVATWIETKNGGEIPSFATKQDFCVGITALESECIGSDCTYYYISIPKNGNGETINLLNLSDEKAIIGIYRGFQEILKYGTVGRSRIMRSIRFAEKEPYFHVVGDRIYLFNGVFPKYCKFNLVYASVDTSDLAETDTFPTADELLPAIMDEVEKIGRREMEGTNDLISDGIDE